MITFEPITEETLYIALELLNSNDEYNRLESGEATRTIEEVRAEYMNEKTTSLFIKADDTYIGLIDFLDKNEKDGYSWIGSFIIHQDYHGYGYGTQAYFHFEQWLMEKDVSTVRLGVLQQNKRGRSFWERAGFHYYTTKTLGQKEVDCFEKILQA